MGILKKRTFYIIAIFLSLIFAIGVSSFSANAASTVNIELILPEDWAGISFTLEEETVDGLGIREDVPVGSNGIAVFEGEESSNYSITCNESNVPKMSNEIAIQTKTVSPEGSVTISIDFGKEWAGSVFSCYTDEETYDECYRTNTKGVLEVTVEKSDNYIICYALASGESVIDNVLNGDSAGGSTTTAQVSNNTQVSSDPSTSPESAGGVTIIGSESPASTSNDTPESTSSGQVTQGNGESSTDPSASPTSVRDIINNAKNDNQSGVANDPNSTAEPNGTITNPDGDSGAGVVTIIIIVIAVLLIAAGIFGVVTLRKRNDLGSKKDKAAKKEPAKTKKVSGFAGLNHSTKNKTEKKPNKGKSANKKSSSKKTTNKSTKPKKQSSESKTGTVHTKKNTQHVEQNAQHSKKTAKNTHTNQHTNKNTHQANKKQDIQKNKKPRNNNDTVYEQDDLEEIIDDENFNENIIVDSREFEGFEENKDEQFNVEVEFENSDDMMDDDLEIDNDDDYEDEFVGDDEFPDNLNIIEEENEEEDEIESKKYNNSRKSQIAQEEEQYEDEYLIEDENKIPPKANKNSRQRKSQSAGKASKNTGSESSRQNSQQRGNHTQAKDSSDDLSKQKEQKQTENKGKTADEEETIQLQKPTRGKRVRKRGAVIEPVEQKGTLDWSDNPKENDNSANSEAVKNETNQAKAQSGQNVLSQSKNVKGKTESGMESNEANQSQPRQRTRTRTRKQVPVQEEEVPQETEQPKRTRTRGKKKNNNQQ